jgi:hypothetical protein
MALQLTGAYKRSSAREPAGAPARGGDRRRPHRHRHGDRAARVLRRAGREDPRALRDARPGDWRGRRHARASTEERALDEQLAHGRRHSGRATGRRGGGPGAELRRPARRVGRRDHRVPQAPGGLAGVPAQPRGGGEVLEEGVRIAERLSPKEALVDDFGAVRAMVFERMAVQDGKLVATGDTVELAARTVCVAAGTAPNVTYEPRVSRRVRDRRAHQAAFQQHRAERDADGRWSSPCRTTRASSPRYVGDGQLVSFYGDNHPVYAGSVVKAMASAKDGYKTVAALFAHEVHRDARRAARPRRAWQAFRARLDGTSSRRRARGEAPHADDRRGGRAGPAAARVQPRAVLPPAELRDAAPWSRARASRWRASPSPARGPTPRRVCSRMIALEMGASSRSCDAPRRRARRGHGPDGGAHGDPRGETVLLAGGGLGNAVLFSIAKALRANGQRGDLLRGLPQPPGRLQADDIEAATDQVVWATDVGPAISRPAAAGPSLRGQHRAGDGGLREGELGVQRVALRSARASSHRLRPDDGRGARGPARRAASHLRPEARRDRQHQLADAVHDEGDLRAVPAAPRRPRHRQGETWCSPASTRIRTSTASTSRGCRCSCCGCRCARPRARRCETPGA